MTPAKLRKQTAKELAQIARSQGVVGWHAMRKEELINAIAKKHRQNRTPNRASTARSSVRRAGHVPRKSRVQEKIAALHTERQQLNDLSNACEGAQSDSLVVLVRDSYWLHFSWDLSAQSVERAKCALAQKWHSASPVLRVHRLDDSGVAIHTRLVAVHGGVRHWYVDVDAPPARYRGEIGYATPDGDFYSMARSNEVLTPAPGLSDSVDENWTDVARNADRIYAMSGGYAPGGVSMELQEVLEQRLRRRLGRPTDTRYGASAAQREGDRVDFSLDVELVVYGSADPNAHLTVLGEPVTVSPDGAFVVKLPFPDRRQVIPLVSCSADGLEQTTIILGVERNTKRLAQQRDSAS